MKHGTTRHDLLSTVSRPVHQWALMLWRCVWGGDRSSAVVVATNHQGSRKKDLQTGDVAIYDNRGQYIALTANGIVIHSDIGVFLDTSSTKAKGDVTDQTEAGNNSTIGSLRDAYNSHLHDGVTKGTDKTKEPDRKV